MCVDVCSSSGIVVFLFARFRCYKTLTVPNMAIVVDECASVLCRLLEASQGNVLYRTLARVFKRFGSPESNSNSPLFSTSKRSGGFTC